MRYEALIAAMLVLSQLAVPAEARDGSASPQFSAADAGTVGRNKLLRALIETDPWLVRDILDAVARRDATYEVEDGNADAVIVPAFAIEGVSRTLGSERDASPARTAAGSVEWIALLRRVRHDKSVHRKESTGRSAKGSVELLETLKKARKDKDSK